MSIRAYAIVNDMGVLFRERQLLVFPRKAEAEKARAVININEDGEFDGRVERIVISLPPAKDARA